MKSIEERFWKKVDKDSHPAGCWIWNGCLNSYGYGDFARFTGKHNFKSVRAHRMSYILHTGEEIPDGLVIDHLCRNRACVNPDHLEVVTYQVNAQRGMCSWEFYGGDTCFKGHPLTEDNIYISIHSRNTEIPVRRCLTCKRESDREYQREKRKKRASEVR